jgi:hypothetical protein
LPASRAVQAHKHFAATRRASPEKVGAHAACAPGALVSGATLLAI